MVCGVWCVVCGVCGREEEWWVGGWRWRELGGWVGGLVQKNRVELETLTFGVPSFFNKKVDNALHAYSITFICVFHCLPIFYRTNLIVFWFSKKMQHTYAKKKETSTKHFKREAGEEGGEGGREGRGGRADGWWCVWCGVCGVGWRGVWVCVWKEGG